MHVNNAMLDLSVTSFKHSYTDLPIRYTYMHDTNTEVRNSNFQKLVRYENDERNESEIGTIGNSDNKKEMKILQKRREWRN